MDAFADDWTAAIRTTFALMLVSSTIAIVIGIPAAASTAMLAQFRAKARILDRLRQGLVSTWILAMMFSIATPLILHAAVWESTAGKFGWLVKTMTGGNLLWVGWIHGVHGAAIVAMATFWATRNIAPEIIQHSALDYGNMAAWFRVRLPIARPWVLASVVIVWMLAATEMSVADLHSVRTVADQFYLFYALDPNMTAITVTTWLPMIVGGIPAIVWLRLRHRQLHTPGRSHHDRASTDFRDSDGEVQFDANKWQRVGVAASIVGMLASLLVCQGAIAAGLIVQAGHLVEVEGGIPVASWSWQACVRSIGNAPSMFASEYAWTLQLALFTSLAVTPLAWALARWGRGDARVGWLIDCAMTMLFLIPGPVVAMAVVHLFASGIPGGELLATQTLIPTIFSVGVRSGVIAYILLRIGYGQISQPVWQSSRLDGNWATRLFRIELPLIWTSGLAALIIAAVVASGDVPAALPVLPPGVTTVGTRLFGLLHSGSRYHEASLAFWYLVAIIVLSWSAWRIAATKFYNESHSRRD
ncbi:ABC transporter permease family protein [Aporhodopirellula aestuarii]|uniref:Amino acid ABC transporter permease n=1 Tax=Aporhodopirellula aestuarii TaxID=2950107 RepID=A0ABT0U6G0_9BACT|nr:amino acid ABC transporter permease [Aporhodopirellula aestuarii]MCM2371978.1 amino acid ABC transporter permease [Aporhodopirellula aestuarii]